MQQCTQQVTLGVTFYCNKDGKNCDEHTNLHKLMSCLPPTQADYMPVAIHPQSTEWYAIRDDPL